MHKLKTRIEKLYERYTTNKLMHRLILVYREVHFKFSSYFSLLEVLMEKIVKRDPY